jgi:fatty acid desaturase
LPEFFAVDLNTYEQAFTSSPEPQPAAFYRRAILEEAQSLPRDPWRLAQFWALVVAFVGLEFLVVTRPEPWVAPLASPFLGLILVSLFCLLHELMHYAVVRNRTVSWIHAWIAGFYSGLTPDSWKDEHDTHHSALGRAGEDPDAVYDLNRWLNRAGTRRAVLFLPGSKTLMGFVARPFWWMAVHGLMLFVRYLQLDRVPRWRKILAVSVWVFDVAAQLTLIAVLGWRYAIFGFLVPVMIQNTLLAYFLLGTHLIAPRSEVMDPVLGSVSVRMGPVLRFFFADAGRHVEHHLFPGTSHRLLGSVSRALEEKFPDRVTVLRFPEVVAALEKSGRVYVGNDLLWDPVSRQLTNPFRHADGKLFPPEPLGVAAAPDLASSHSPNSSTTASPLNPSNLARAIR